MRFCERACKKETFGILKIRKTKAEIDLMSTGTIESVARRGGDILE